MFKHILAAVGAFFAGLTAEAAPVLKSVGQDVVQGVESVAPEAEAYMSGLVTKYTPIAVAQVKAAATDPDLLSGGEKQSAVFTKLAQALEADGHDITANGFNAFVNMLVEIGVNTVKLIEGTFLGAAAAVQQPAEDATDTKSAA